MDRRTRRSTIVGALAVLALAVVLGIESVVTGVVVGVLGLAAVLAIGLWSGRRGRHTPWSRAQALIAPGRAVVLWKPGCAFCERLLLQMGQDDRVTWVNVWQDEGANARLRGLNGGDEYTPTALVGEDVLRNPTAAELRARL